MKSLAHQVNKDLGSNDGIINKFAQTFDIVAIVVAKPGLIHVPQTHTLTPNPVTAKKRKEKNNFAGRRTSKD